MRNAISKMFGQVETSDPGTPICFEYWDGTVDSFGRGRPLFTVRFNGPDALRHTLANRFLGFGESYMDGGVDVEGNWDCLFRVAMGLKFHHARPSLKSVARFALLRLRTRDTRRKARSNITRHYDFGNEFYSLWLDRSMTYSCAYFQTPDTSLDEAQEAKLERICRKLWLRPGMTLLDVGCGWGSLLIHAARGTFAELINLQDVRGEAKAYQVRQLLKLVERHNYQLGELAE